MRKLELPERGVAAGAGVGMPAAVVLIYVLDTFLLPAPLPAAVASAIGSLVTAAVAWLVQRSN